MYSHASSLCAVFYVDQCDRSINKFQACVAWRPGFLYSTRSIDAMFVWLIDMERLTFEIRKVVVY
jgi:hypothetical protein